MAGQQRSTKTCTVTECPKTTVARGLCAMHYQRVRSHGTTDKWVKPKVPVPHGTLQGYNFHRCRCEECSATWRDYSRQWREQRADELRNYQLLHAYGMTREEYDALLAKQDGVCAICRQVNVAKGRWWMDVDHDHATGAVRGILCNTCNRHLGKLEARLARWPEAMAYLGWRRADR